MKDKNNLFKKSKFHYAKDLEISIVAGICFSFGCWFIDSEMPLTKGSFVGLFLFGAMVMAISIIGIPAIERLLKLKTYMAHASYMELRTKNNINRLILILHEIGFVLEQSDGNNYWFKIDNFIIFKCRIFVRDQREYCTILLKKTDVRSLARYVECINSEEQVYQEN
jgi:hypothetical protein